MPKSTLCTDEWYELGEEHSKELNYFLSVDEKSFSPKTDNGKVKGEGMWAFHPIAWYQQLDGGDHFIPG